MSDKRKREDRPRRRQDHERHQEQNSYLYQQLFQTLATEHRKLRDLEQRRGRLMEDMRELRTRLMHENTHLRRTIQAGAVVEPGPSPSPSKAGGGGPRGASNRSAPKRVAARSVAYNNQGAPTTTRRRHHKPTAIQHVAPRLSRKREEPMPDVHGHAVAPAAARRKVGVPKRMPLPKRNVHVSAQNRQNITERRENDTEEAHHSVAALLDLERQPSSSTGRDGEHQSTGQHLEPAHPPPGQCVSAIGLESISEVSSYGVPTNPPPSLCDDSEQQQELSVPRDRVNSVSGLRLLQRIGECLQSS